MFKLGEIVFFADIEGNTALSGACVSNAIDEQGHSIVTVKTERGVFYALHEAYCSHNEKEIRDKLPSFIALNARIIEIQSQANREIDEILNTMRGKPRFEHLTIKAEKKEA